MITSESQDMVFAIVNSKEDAQIDTKIEMLIEMAFRDSLGIENPQQIIDFAKRKQVQIAFDKTPSASQTRTAFRAN